KENISTVDAEGNVLEAFYVLDPAACGTTKQFCRLAIAPNNHVDSNGNKKWLVFKGLQGTLQIDKFSVDGTTIINAARKPQTAMQITFYDDNPLKIRNLGFSTVSIETGTSGTEGYENTPTYQTYSQKVIDENGNITTTPVIVPNFDSDHDNYFLGFSTVSIETCTSGTEGYENTPTYQTYSQKVIDENGNITTTPVSVPNFDRDTEKGFLGLNMHGNLHLDGTLKIFSYNCSGAAG